MWLTIVCLGFEKQNKKVIYFTLFGDNISLDKMLHCNHQMMKAQEVASLVMHASYQNIIISLCQNTLKKQKKQPNPELPF
jgi:hypothetical protein